MHINLQKNCSLSTNTCFGLKFQTQIALDNAVVVIESTAEHFVRESEICAGVAFGFVGVACAFVSAALTGNDCRKVYFGFGVEEFSSGREELTAVFVTAEHEVRLYPV